MRFPNLRGSAACSGTRRECWLQRGGSGLHGLQLHSKPPHSVGILWVRFTKGQRAACLCSTCLGPPLATCKGWRRLVLEPPGSSFSHTHGGSRRSRVGPQLSCQWEHQCMASPPGLFRGAGLGSLTARWLRSKHGIPKRIRHKSCCL